MKNFAWRCKKFELYQIKFEQKYFKKSLFLLFYCLINFYYLINE